MHLKEFIEGDGETLGGSSVSDVNPAAAGPPGAGESALKDKTEDMRRERSRVQTNGV